MTAGAMALRDGMQERTDASHVDPLLPAGVDAALGERHRPAQMKIVWAPSDSSMKSVALMMPSTPS
jgi:hypothetical protein